MSNAEFDRLDTIKQLDEKRLTRAQAGEILGLSVRQIQRILNRYREEGVSGLLSRKRGQPSNRKYPDSFKEYALFLVADKYADFGPTFACEKLGENHELYLSVETLRCWMTDAGLWSTRKEQKKKVHQPRNRRDCFGELVQIDGSEHHWFEDRGPKCTLLVYIDDATSTLLELRFVASESTFDYFYATQEYLERYGKPIAFYSDQHSVFRVNKKGATGGDGMTQFGRALHALNIDIICANSSQAKGRVERANRTLQDRLVKELRLKRINTIEAGNKFLEEFREDFNQRFAKPAKNPKDVHRPLAKHENLEEIFTWQEERTVTKNLTVQYDRVVYLLEPNDITAGLIKKKVQKHSELPMEEQIRLIFKSRLEPKLPSESEVANLLNMSRRNMQLKLKRSGATYREIRQSFLMEESIRLIKEEQQSVTYAALELGFSDTSNFVRSFKKWFGTSPSNYS